MRVLVTGNRGYIGAVLTELLLTKGYGVVGYDTDYYEDWEPIKSSKDIKQIKKDIRQVSENDLENIDAIVHLAALSNDPLGDLDPKLTDEINFRATVKLANLSKEVGIKRFIFASSCSMYGIAGTKTITEDAPLEPLTPYAVSKTNSEQALSKIADNNFSPVFLRPGTAYGPSPRLRCDLVVNNLTGWAYTTGKIKIMSDGTPWRPVIHIDDLCQAFIACLEAPIEIVQNEAFNLGQNEENYQIRDIANVIKEIIPGSEIEYTHQHGPDSRSYKVSFDKINSKLKDFFHPKWKLKQGVIQLYDTFKSHGLTYEEFTGNKYIRINRLKELIEKKKLNQDLFWVK